MRPLLPYCFTSVALLAIFTLSTAAVARNRPAPPRTPYAPTYHSMVPLGAILYQLKPAKRDFYLEVSALDPAFEGMQVKTVAERPYVVDPSGARVQRYPEHLTFRVSAGVQVKKAIDSYREPVRAACDLNYYLSHLRFRVKVFRGLYDHAMHPAAVYVQPGPSSAKVEGRVYEVAFDMQNVPLEDRVVLEVLSPSGERIGKFHLDLY